MHVRVQSGETNNVDRMTGRVTTFALSRAEWGGGMKGYHEMDF